MATYPGGIPALTNPTSGDNLNTVGVLHATQHANANDEIEAIATELGVTPSGAAATVAARFTALDSLVAGKAAAGDRGETLATALDQGTTPAVLVVLGDSTGMGGGYGEWVENLGVLIGAQWPLTKVTHRLWNGTTAYGSPSTIANGSATPVLDIYNGSQASGVATYPVSRIPAMIPAEPDAVILSFGHNHTTDTAADLQTDLADLVTAVRATWPDAPVIVSSQNPQVSPASTPANHNNRQLTLRAWAAPLGYGYVPGYEAFVAQVTPSAFIQGDGVHPTISGASDGSVLWADAALRTLTAASLAPVAAASGTALTVQDENANVSTSVAQIDFQGAGVTTTAGTGEVIVTIPGGSGYVYRDRLVAAAGNAILTLGATPVANSPLVWVNNTVKWVTTDYTISSNVITFGSALSASDVVLVQYHSAASSASASALSTAGVNILDTFTRADSTSTMGSTTTGGNAWTALAGTWGITSNKGYLVSGPSGGIGLATVDAGVADCTMSVVVTTARNAATIGGLTFRATDASNLYAFETTVGAAYAPLIWKKVAGTLTILATGASTTVNVGDTISVALAGTSLTVKKNGTTIVSVTDSTYTTQTKHGLYNFTSVGVAGAIDFDTFSIQP